MRLKDKIAIVTGASRGIGAEIARMFAEEGARVVLAARSVDALEALHSEIARKNGACLVLEVDVRKREDVQKMAEETFSYYGTVDILVNNAGVPIYKHAIDDPDTDAEKRYQEIMDTNLRGYWYSARFVAPFMKKRKRGSIINISSVRGHAGLAHESAYCAAKGGVNMLTKSLAVELAPYNIRVNSISPGAIQVALGHWVLSRYGKKAHTIYVERFKDMHLLGMKLNQPLRMIAEPKDVAFAAVYFASEESRFVTGSDLLIDGGLTALLAEPGALDMESFQRLYRESKEMRDWLDDLE
jgi:NAD(P)-dependent dehydrogenase (short-subunit alcohol dehydrogenase family)